MKTIDLFSLFLALQLVFSACGPTELIRKSGTDWSITKPKNVDFVKIYLKNGGLYVLEDWTIDNSGNTIIGTGKLYNYKRNLIQTIDKTTNLTGGNFYTISKDEIALIETNVLKNHPGNLGALAIIGVPSFMFSMYCILNPKACFGSCPTFYALENGKWTLMSEGFSSSVFPKFEKSDIDMLYFADQAHGEMSLKLTNEALETHVIRFVDLLAFPENTSGKIYATEEGIFFRTYGVIAPESCVAAEGDCLGLVNDMDRNERWCESDSKNLSKKEEIIVHFSDVTQKDLGLLIGSRQTLLTTYLFYQAMAYSGNYYGQLAADLQNGNSYLANRFQKIWDKLGGIEVFLKTEAGSWQKIGELNEMGPIATDVHLVKLPPHLPGNLTIKLRLTKGLWRIDYLALAKISGEEFPVRIKPEQVVREDLVDHEALLKLTGNTYPLVTFPGDSFMLKYKLPSECSYQFFLETKGYYLEWMRDEWLAEQNLNKLAVAFSFPGLFMKMAAPGFKKAEPNMEKIFWESRYVKP